VRSILLGFTAGVGVLQTQAALQSISLTVAAMLAAAAVLVALRNVCAAVRLPLFMVCGTVLGFCWATLFAQAYLQHALPPELEGRDLAVTGIIANLPAFTEQGARFDFQIEQVLSIDGTVPSLPERVSLSWPAGFQGRHRLGQTGSKQYDQKSATRSIRL
jgi:competence protein ComEC